MLTYCSSHICRSFSPEILSRTIWLKVSVHCQQVLGLKPFQTTLFSFFLCVLILRDRLHLLFSDLHVNFSPLLANKTSRWVWFSTGQIISLPEVQNSPKPGRAESLGVTGSDTSGLLNSPRKPSTPPLSINHRSWGGLAGQWSFLKAEVCKR